MSLPVEVQGEELIDQPKPKMPPVNEAELEVPVTELSKRIKKLEKPIDYPDATGFDAEFNVFTKTLFS
jgi:hypothetical protein